LSFSIYLGPYQPFLEQSLFDEIKGLRSADPLAPLVILVPNRLLVRHLHEALAREHGQVFNIRFLTFHQYLLEATEAKWIEEGFRMLPESLVPWVLRETARDLKTALRSFQAVEDTPGFHKTLQATLSELRQAGIDPADLKESSRKIGRDKTRKRLSEKWDEFSRILEAYQAWKRQEKWKDREDLYVDALTLPPPETPLWTYGFYDAPTLQIRTLLHLCSKQDSRCFIPFEEHPAYEYAKPFVEWAKKHGTVKKVGKFESGKETPLGKLQDNLFKSEPPQDTPHPSPLPQGERVLGSPSPLRGEGGDEGDGSTKFEESDLKILLCPGEPREMREVVRAITEEAERRKTTFTRCGLILRQFDAYRREIVPAFDNQKIPLAKKPPVFLLETPEAKAFLLLLECFQNEFPRETLMNFLSSPNLEPEGFGLKPGTWNPHLWDQASKEAGIVEGEGAWLDRMEDHLRSGSSSEGRDEEGFAKEEWDSLKAFRNQVLQALFKGRQLFEKEKNWVGKTRVLFDLVEKIFRPSDAKEQLKTLRRGVEILSKDSFTVEKDELASLLSGLMDEVKIPWKIDDFGGVELSDLMQARGVPFDVVVLPGLVEQGFPRVPRQDPLLLDEERRLLNGLLEGKAHIPEKAEGRLEEKLLFLLSSRSARKCLILTASHLHPDKGAPRVPSSYLHEALRAVTGKRQVKWDEPSPYIKKVAVSDWIRDEGETRVDDLEEVLTRFQEAREKNPLPALAYLDEKPFFQEAREMLQERQGKRRFTPYDGVFQTKAAIQRLKESHSLKDKTLSASRLETYAVCPLKYFYRYVLGLKIHPEPERVFQLDPADKGNLMHEVLEEVLSRGVKEGWLKVRDLEKARKALSEETKRIFTRFEKEGVPGSLALWQWSQFILSQDMEKVLREVLEDPDWTPVDFEKAFGRSGQAEVVFKTPSGNFRLEGFMDRVDVSADGKHLRVVDYKSGKSEGFKNNSVKDGTKIQMPLYLWACRTLYPNLIPQEAVYEFITAKGQYDSKGFDASDWSKVEEPLKALLTTATQAVEQGLFPAAAKDCEYCDFKLLCGPGAEKRGERKREDIRVGDYFKLEELP
jgi:ATP-dependent helicase/DNAse subunit B